MKKDRVPKKLKDTIEFSRIRQNDHKKKLNLYEIFFIKIITPINFSNSR